MNITNSELLEAVRGQVLDKLKMFGIAGKVEPVGFWLLELKVATKKALEEYNQIIEELERAYDADIVKMDDGSPRVVNNSWVFKDKNREKQFIKDRTDIMSKVVEIKVGMVPYSLVKDEIKDVVTLEYINPLLDREK